MIKENLEYLMQYDEEVAKAIELVDVFLDTKFSNEERHIRRIAQVTDLENRF